MQIKDSNDSPIAGVWHLTSDNRFVTFDGTLTDGASYQLVISQNVRHLALNPMGTEYQTTFTGASSSLSADTKAPEVETVWQADGNVYVRFTEDIDPATIGTDAVTLTASGTPIEGSSAPFDARTIEFTPTSGLNEGNVYDLTINAGVADLSGRPLTSDLWPLTFTYTAPPVAFYSKPDQRQERTASAYNQNRFFQGHPYEDELGLYYVRNRYFDQAIISWLSGDPNDYQDIYNLTNIIISDYANQIDPYGLSINWHKDMIGNDKRKDRMRLYKVIAQMYRNQAQKALLDNLKSHPIPVYIKVTEDYTTETEIGTDRAKKLESDRILGFTTSKYPRAYFKPKWKGYKPFHIRRVKVVDDKVQYIWCLENIFIFIHYNYIDKDYKRYGYSRRKRLLLDVFSHESKHAYHYTNNEGRTFIKKEEGGMIIQGKYQPPEEVSAMEWGRMVEKDKKTRRRPAKEEIRKIIVEMFVNAPPEDSVN